MAFECLKRFRSVILKIFHRGNLYVYSQISFLPKCLRLSNKELGGVAQKEMYWIFDGKVPHNMTSFSFNDRPCPESLGDMKLVQTCARLDVAKKIEDAFVPAALVVSELRDHRSTARSDRHKEMQCCVSRMEYEAIFHREEMSEDSLWIRRYLSAKLRLRHLVASE